MQNFPHADTARRLSEISRSFEMLCYAANDAIMATAKTAKDCFAYIDYSGVSPLDHQKFHLFITSNGYQGNIKRIDGNAVYKISWEE